MDKSPKHSRVIERLKLFREVVICVNLLYKITPEVIELFNMAFNYILFELINALQKNMAK